MVSVPWVITTSFAGSVDMVSNMVCRFQGLPPVNLFLKRYDFLLKVNPGVFGDVFDGRGAHMVFAEGIKINLVYGTTNGKKKYFYGKKSCFLWVFGLFHF